MKTCSLRDVIEKEEKGKGAVFAFNAFNYGTIRGIFEAHVLLAKIPVLQMSEKVVRYIGEDYAV